MKILKLSFLLFLTIITLGQTKRDTENPIVGGFQHMGAVFSLYDGDRYIASIFDNKNQIKVFFLKNGKWGIIYSIPPANTFKNTGKFEFNWKPQTGIYIFTYGDRMKILFLDDRIFTIRYS